MQSSHSIEPPDSADPRGTSNRARGPFGKLLSVVRGDKYMADAYEPAWSAAMERRTGPNVALPGTTPQLAPSAPNGRIAVAAASDARAVTDAHLEMERWVDEGGLVPFEAAAVLRATTRRR